MSKNQSVFVAGVGVISAIGNNRIECISALQNGRTGIGPITNLRTVHKDVFPVGEVKLSNLELANQTGLNSNVPRTALLSFMAAKEALYEANIPELESLRTGFISANSVGGMDLTEIFFENFLPNNEKGRLINVINHECGSVTDLVAQKLGIRHFVSTISTACSSSANSILLAARLIRQGLLDVVVAGGADALTRFTLNGFNTLMILDPEPCKPFDANRNWLNLGEGAGYLVLVSEKIAALLSNTYCLLSGYHNSNDAYHQTASSPEGIGSYMAMQGALKKSGVEPHDIGYINLHGTGTQNNDRSEATAIKRLFEAAYPLMSSTKAFTGHTLGGCGGIEAVFSALSIKSGFIYPNLRFKTQMEEFPFSPEINFSVNPTLKNVLSNSFGFGGNCTSLIFSAV